MSTPVQIDPAFCGCTECLTGEYVPLSEASDAQIFALIAGTLSDATSERFTLTTTTEDCLSERPITTTTVTAQYCGRSWTKEEA